jgi:transcriptional regulator with XRE-family HTH domain
MPIRLLVKDVREATLNAKTGKPWTQVELAKKLRMEQPAFSKFERNRLPKRIDVRLLTRIARVLGVPLAALLRIE